MNRSTSRSIVYSLAAHIVLMGGLLALARDAARNRPAHDAPPATVTLEVVDAPRPPPRVVVAPVVPPVVAPASRVVQQPASRRVDHTEHTAEPSAAVASAEPSVTTEVGPAVAQPSAAVGTAEAPHPAMSGMQILTSLDHDAYAAAVDGHAIDLGHPGSGRPSRNLFGSESDRGATAYDRVRAAAQGDILEQLAASNHNLEPPGTSPYLRALRHRIEEGWQPRDARVASTARSITGAVVTSVAEAQATAHQAMGPLGDGPGAAAVASLAAAHANSDSTQDMAALGFAAGGGVALQGSTVATTAQVVLEQDATGAILSLRVLVSSQRPGFDATAIDAVRTAVGLDAATAMPGGRRTVWLFRVEATSHPAAPTAGFRFDESGGRGVSPMFMPSSSQHRARIQLLSSRPLHG